MSFHRALEKALLNRFLSRIPLFIEGRGHGGSLERILASSQSLRN